MQCVQLVLVEQAGLLVPYSRLAVVLKSASQLGVRLCPERESLTGKYLHEQAPHKSTPEHSARESTARDGGE